MLHFHVVCLVEFTSQCIRSYAEKFSNSVADAGERRPKHLLLTFPIHIVIAISVSRLMSELWNQPLWPDVWVQQVQRLSNFRRVDVSLFALQDCGFENGKGF